jgi:hypothetical protein
LLSALDVGRFDFHWFETGTPGFLLKVLRQDRRFDLVGLEQRKLSSKAFNHFDIEQIDTAALLFQTGYLTIREVMGEFERTYSLGYPNYEVRKAFFVFLLESLTGIGRGRSVQPIETLLQAMVDHDLKRFAETLRHDILSELPYDMHIPIEKYYQSIFHIVLVMLGLAVRGEERTNRGRIDNALELDNSVYIFEMKLEGTAREAIDQIKEKRYYERYLKTGKRITLVGIDFRDRTVDDIDWEDHDPSS